MKWDGMETHQTDTLNLHHKAEKLGADLFGIADIRPVQKFITQQGGQILEGFSHAVVLGVRLSNTVVDQLDPLMPADYSLYGFHVYKAVSPFVDWIALKIALTIEEGGFRALPIPTSQFRRPGQRISIFPHKLAARLAGLGWIGKNCLLITPEFGPRIRLASVLTDCELEAGTIIEGNCGDCRVCADVCPVDAIKGVEFCESEGLEKRLDVNACGSYRDGADSGARRGAHVCALCLAKCPKGQSIS
jgi:epoxyqueuosine reductase